ncbi:MAG: ATP-binding protein, partial [Myxococcales bacterium]|nr:ATP-binding protein [Myxococcales bacterium]
ARVLGIAAVVAFLFPTLTLFLPMGAEMAYVTIALLASFPAIMGYAIVRLGMFDIRVVLGQGLIYVTLSVAVLVGYLFLVALAFHGVDSTAQRPIVMGALVAASVIFLSLVQMRVQGAINRLVFRSRYLLGDALAQASHKLLRAHSQKEALDTLRAALLDTMQLSRAAIAVRRPGDDVLGCRVLGSRPDPITGELPATLPDELDPARFRPVARALGSHDPISTHDSQGASALVADVEPGADGSDEASFWTHYGIEWIVPIHFRQGDEEELVAAGVLLLGPKLDGRALDGSDRSLMITLANQLAVAIENTRAFEEIQRLKDGLEAQVDARTQDLSEALAELKQTQGHLVESEKQAMLGRVVAGIVHEVNSPLGSLRSSIDTTDRLLSRMHGYLATHAEGGDPEARRLLAAIDSGAGLLSVMQQSGDRIDGLVESLKRFVSLDESEMKPLDVREGIDSALTLLSPVLGEDIDVQRHYPNTAPVVRCYPARLNQVFLNLIENAAHSIEDEGTGEVRIGVSNDNGRVEIEVADNGRGIAPERIQTLFDFGFTNKAGRVRMRLGLPSNKRTIEELGGELTIESEVGQGTRVQIALPGA